MNEGKFAVNDRVYQVIPRVDGRGKRILGTITDVYRFGGMDRYVVKFDDDSEGVFFEFELVAT